MAPGETGLRGPVGPTGPQGETGPATALSIGTVTSGDKASATITGEPPAQTLNLTLPRGEQGLQGPTGLQGPPGAVPTTRDYLLVGPGRPDQPASTGGVITGREPVGCEYRSTDGAGVGAWAWRKRPDGWTITDGDTGWRNVTRAVGAHAAVDGLYLRRIGWQVHMLIRFSGDLPDASTPLTGELPAGFLPVAHPMSASRRPLAPIGREDATRGWLRLMAQNELAGVPHLMSTTMNLANTRAEAAWATVNPWPATLPGTPA